MKPGHFRWLLFLAGAACAAAGCIPFATLPSFDAPSTGRTFGFVLQFIGLFLCWGFFPIANAQTKQSALLILTLSIVLRALLWPTPESDDVHRYRWEGNLVLSGENPYFTTADDPVWIEFRDTDWEAMNHKDRGTVYPPLAQFTFAGLSSLNFHNFEWNPQKMAFLLADLGIILLVLLLLRRKNLPYSYALFYAVNPISLLSFAGEAHYDSLFVLALVASILCLETGRIRTSWILLAASIQLKFISLILLPIWVLRRQFRGSLIAAVLLLVFWIPFLDAIPSWIRSVGEFGGGGTFQGLIPFLLRIADLPESRSAPIGALLLLLSLFVIYLKGGNPSSLARRSLGALILCSPVLHFWYLSWILPFVALRPSFSWLWLCASQALYFLVWPRLATSGYWELPPGTEWFIWGPFLGFGLWELNRFLRCKRILPASSASVSPQTLGIVIPTLQSGPVLPKCLAAIASSTRQPDQCVIVDGGSSDHTASIASEYQIPLIQSPLGRGQQIKAGIDFLNTDWVLILHADCEIDPQAIESMTQLDSEVTGGGCGQRFNPGSSSLTLIESMNEGRAVLGESYWGDQGMFLRKADRNVWSTLDQFPLMEDVEMSRLLRREGETRYLGRETRAGSIKWSRGKKSSRFLLVLSTVIRFRIATLFGRQARIAGDLYRRYYKPD
ncbi:MAG: glycosyltransferase [Puniceicoccales bacterium]